MYIPVEKIPLPAEDIPLPSQNILPEDIPLPPENVFVPLEDIPLPSEIPPVKINESPMAEVPPVKIIESENLSAEITDTPTEDLSTQIIDSPSEDLPVEMNESPSDVLSVEISDSVPEVVVEETAQMEPEEVQVVSPSRDVFAPIDNITLKDAIYAERSKAELEPENFSPAEKKNKSIDIAEIDKEPQDVVVDMPTEPQDTVRDPNSEINSTGLVKDANTPKPTSNETDDLEGSSSSISEEKPYKTVPPVRTEPEMVPIEGNLTVVSERDLADGQVEITTEQVISPKKPVMLSNFSMDFLDSASDSNSNSTLDTLSDFASRPDFNAKGTEFTSKAMTKQIRKIEQKKQHTYERLELLNILEGNSDVEKKSQLPKRNVPDDICDFEEHIPSQIVSTKKLKKDGTLVESEFPYVEKIKGNEKSKLLERLTVTTNKSETKTPLGKPIKGQTIMIRGNKYMGKVKMPLRPLSSKVKKALDIEDVEPFVIQKDQKKAQIDSDIKETVPLTKSTGKAKILQQTIITPAGEIIQPTVNPIQVDDNIFDINSMPIVLSDEILTPESIENMPIMISGDTKMLEQEKPVKKLPSKIIGKTITVTQPVTSKTQVVAKQPKSPRILQTVGGKVLKNSPLLPNIAKPGKYLILPQGGTQTAKYITKKGPVVKRTEVIPKTQNIAPEPSGNKIMIVTNQQGQQQRLLLTPAQQKMLGYQTQKTTRTVVKGNIIQKSVLATKSSTIIEPGTSGIISKGSSLVGQKVILSRLLRVLPKKVHPMSQKMLSGVTTGKTQKTILIKNQHGHTVRKIQGTDDELLDKQVAEQLEAIKAKVKPPPPAVVQQQEVKPAQDRPLNQLVIQDAVGNQTTITEGQILALPSETVDGQPQSYMLVTLDESGNLTPLNNEALMSLDPNLGLGGDLSNMVLQIDQSALADQRPQSLVVKASLGSEPPKLVEIEPPPPAPVPVPEPAVTTEHPNGEPGQQLIVTGDPIATQKFLESLTEGTTDLANILANAEVNNDSLNASESTEGGGNPIFATQPSKNQDILAAALADTDVFQQEQHAAHSKITSQLSPSNALYPMNFRVQTAKKIPDDEADILTQVPKNVDLPITITDPNIAQTVANQQVASLMVNELHTNLELTLPVSETTISSVSTEMNSPYVYSLPTLDESVDLNQKPFNSSMPLLNEDIEEASSKSKSKMERGKLKNGKGQAELSTESSFLEEEEGRFTLGGEMCSSLSEPPPEMFDLPELDKRSGIPSSLQSTPDVSDNARKMTMLLIYLCIRRARTMAPVRSLCSPKL
ncbi:hypothetical protein NQ317_013342 [Molorchus minor]|uniref:Uncharacterized protein n=1 Tax=Molorchus minor TaxID=1323400 RepID=A0ABQ9IUW0_9CUCU|nr:hypothetical protein NQ317_013342 [Molorchus minor]